MGAFATPQTRPSSRQEKRASQPDLSPESGAGSGAVAQRDGADAIRTTVAEVKREALAADGRGYIWHSKWRNSRWNDRLGTWRMESSTPQAAGCIFAIFQKEGREADRKNLSCIERALLHTLNKYLQLRPPPRDPRSHVHLDPVFRGVRRSARRAQTRREGHSRAVRLKDSHRHELDRSRRGIAIICTITWFLAGRRTNFMRSAETKVIIEHLHAAWRGSGTDSAIESNTMLWSP